MQELYRHEDQRCQRWWRFQQQSSKLCLKGNNCNESSTSALPSPVNKPTKHINLYRMKLSVDFVWAADGPWKMSTIRNGLEAKFNLCSNDYAVRNKRNKLKNRVNMNDPTTYVWEIQANPLKSKIDNSIIPKTTRTIVHDRELQQWTYQANRTSKHHFCGWTNSMPAIALWGEKSHNSLQASLLLTNLISFPRHVWRKSERWKKGIKITSSTQTNQDSSMNCIQERPYKQLELSKLLQ